MYLPMGGVKNESARRFHEFFCHQDWNIGIVRDPIQVFLEPDARPEVHWLPPPGRGRFVADPFGIADDEGVSVFCEEYDYQSHKGVISWTRVPRNGPPSSWKVAIERPFHMSYPYLLEWEGEVYCVPETHEAREISLHRANQFPARWTKVKTLVPNFAGVDPTVFHHQGRWWMTCGDADTGANETLFVWHARELGGPWEPHVKNPVKRGRNGTRPAGTPFEYHGQLYRPAMDSSRTYGRRIVLNRVRKLTPTEFEEEPAEIIEPFAKGPYRDGIHTLSAVGDITLVDGLRITFEKSEFDRAARNGLREFLGVLTPLWHKE